MSFVDEIIAARRRTLRDEEDAAAAVQRSFATAERSLQAKIKELEQMERAGKFKSAAQARRQAEATLAEVRAHARSAARDAAEKITAMKEQVIKNTLAEATQITAEAAGEEASLTTMWSQVPHQAVRDMARRDILGVSASDATARIAENMVDRVRDRLASGIAAGDSIGDIVDDLDETTDISRAALNRVVRTNLSAASNDALRTAYEENSDVLDGYVWDATLDERACIVCATLHGTFYELGSVPPGPPVHPNCRCLLVPHFADPDLQSAADEGDKRVRPLLESGERSRRTEMVRSDKRFEAWLRDQPAAATQNVTGGEIKDRLWRSGAVPFTELVKPDLSTRTNEEVVRRALAFNPRNEVVKRYAEELGVKRVSPETILKEDRALERGAPFTFGERAGVDKATAARRARIDEARASLLRRRDAVSRAVRD